MNDTNLINIYLQVKRGAEDQKKKLSTQLDAVQEFDKLKDNLGSWLNAKTKMAGVLGPLAIEPAMIDNQLEQVCWASQVS